MRTIYQFQKKIFMGKSLRYKGVNMSGQTYFVYADGSYSYINRDQYNRLSSIYHREKDGRVDFVRLGMWEKKTELSSDEESSNEESSEEEVGR